MSVSYATDRSYTQGAISDIGRALAAHHSYISRPRPKIESHCSTYLFSIGKRKVHAGRREGGRTARLPQSEDAARGEGGRRDGRESGGGRRGKRGTLSI
jgi:hypothetical protein